MKNTRYQPSAEELANMSTPMIVLYYRDEANYYRGKQKQTAAARALDEAANRLERLSS